MRPLLKLFTPPSDPEWRLLHFSHMATSNKHIFTFLKLLQLIKCCHNWFLKKLKQYTKETRFHHHMDEKKLHTLEFQLKGIRENTRSKLLQKRSTG